MSSKSSKIKKNKHPTIAKNPLPKIKSLNMFWVFFKLGLTCFGGPTAHIGFFFNMFVEQKKWLTAKEYAEIVSLCQFLPGPTSSQVGMSIGLKCGGISQAFAAWLGFTLPSMIIMIAAGYGILIFDETSISSVLHMLKLFAAAIVLQAVISMAKSLTPDWTRRILSLFATFILVISPSAFMQLFILGAGVIAGIVLNHYNVANIEITEKREENYTSTPFLKRIGLFSGALFLIILLGLPVLGFIHNSLIIEIVTTFFQSGALVFGGGHVVLPLLQSQLVPNGLISHADFMAGYGIVQAIPGPLFTFAAYLGVLLPTGWPEWISGIFCLIIIFLPAILLVLAVIPIWENIRGNRYIQSGLYGVNAVVVGLLLAALINPILILSIKSWIDIAIVLILYVLLLFGKVPIWLMILAVILSAYLWSFI